MLTMNRGLSYEGKGENTETPFFPLFFSPQPFHMSLNTSQTG